MPRPAPVIAINDKPLVSVLVFNYNYARYLPDCLESIAAQTYENVEIVFADNSSTDGSWEIACEFQQKYPNFISLISNRQNFGADDNALNCLLNARGKYLIMFCSDDIMKPTYIEKCVAAMESHNDLGFVVVHRDIMDGEGQIKQEAPFYNMSCNIPGHEQAAVYMMAALNPTASQVMYNQRRTKKERAARVLSSRWYAGRMTDFLMATEFNVGYISEPLVSHRIHGANDSLNAAANLMEIIGPYVLNLEFAETARVIKGFEKVGERLPASIEKIAQLSLRYSLRGLIKGDIKLAKKYFYLARSFSEDIEDSEVFKQLDLCFRSNETEREAIVKNLQSRENLETRSVSYDPPPGSTPL